MLYKCMFYVTYRLYWRTFWEVGEDKRRKAGAFGAEVAAEVEPSELEGPALGR